jgi:hypothetical protein
MAPAFSGASGLSAPADMLDGIPSMCFKRARTINDETDRDGEDAEPEGEMLEKSPNAERARSHTPKADLGRGVRSKVFMVRNIASYGSAENACRQKAADGPAYDEVVERAEDARADERAGETHIHADVKHGVGHQVVELFVFHSCVL